MKEQTLVIMRGIPGSGKSTIAKKLAVLLDAVICSADDYFMIDGEYKFDSQKLGKAHENCYENAFKLLASCHNVIIDNTSTTIKEFKKYIEIPVHKNVIIVNPNNDWSWDVNECFKRNTHNVPKETIQAMFDRFVSSFDEKIVSAITNCPYTLSFDVIDFYSHKV